MADIIHFNTPENESLEIEDIGDVIRCLSDDMADLLSIEPNQLAGILIEVDGMQYTAFEVLNIMAQKLFVYTGKIDKDMQE